MDKDNIKRKSVDDDFDDSFEWFLPNKKKDKNTNSRNTALYNKNNGNKRKNMSSSSSYFSSSSSSLSQETCDSVMENVVTVCLSKTDSVTHSKITAKNKNAINWKDIASKMKRQPLLMTRTAADREAILSQKLALILVDNDENNKSRFNKSTTFEIENLLQSDVLLQQWCKVCRLWSASIKPPSNLISFYINIFSNYIDFDNIEPKDFSSTHESFKFDVDRPEDIVLSGNAEQLSDNLAFTGFGYQIDNQHDDEKENSSIDIFETCPTEALVDSNVNSPEDTKEISKRIGLVKDEEQINSCNNNKILISGTYQSRLASSDFIELSSISSEHSVHLPAKYVSDSEQTLSPTRSVSTINTEELKSKLGMLDRIGVTLMAEQWDNLFNSNNGDVIVSLEDEAKLNVHKFIITVRCQPILYEITEDNKLSWNTHPLIPAQAFFRYLYTGKCDHLWNLTTLDKAVVKRLASLYQLSHLEEVLIKLHKSKSSRITKKLPAFSQTMNAVESTKHSFSEEVNQKSSNYLVLSRNISPVSSEDSVIDDRHLFTHQISSDSTNIEDENHDVEINSDSIGSRNEHDFDISPVLLNKYGHSPQQQLENEYNRHCAVKKSLEAYFQDSFPEIPLLSDETIPTCPTTSEIIESYQGTSRIVSPEFNRTINTDPHYKSSLLSPVASGGLPLMERVLLPSTSTALSPNRRTPTPSQTASSLLSSEILFSKNATPFPNYDDMVTPLLKKELKRFGLKGNLGSTKAKLILKYIYDQTHPVVDSPDEEERSGDRQVLTQTSSNSVKDDSLTTTVENIIKRNEQLNLHVLLFKPIWLENFHQLLKDHGVICSTDQLKDSLNELCITYRTKTKRWTKSSRKSKKKNIIEKL